MSSMQSPPEISPPRSTIHGAPSPARRRRAPHGFDIWHSIALGISLLLPAGLWARGFDAHDLFHAFGPATFAVFGGSISCCLAWIACTLVGIDVSWRERRRWLGRWLAVMVGAFATISIANASLWYAVRGILQDGRWQAEALWCPKFVLLLLANGALCVFAGIALVFQTHSALALPKPRSFDDVIARERSGVAARQQAALGRPAQTFGLALSGGGLRSATINVGVMEALATESLAPTGREALRRFDYLSSVSGGGWVAGAVVAALARNIAPREFIQELVGRFRRANDYVIPGGVGLSRATLRPLILIAFGIAINLLVFLPFLFSALLLAHTASQYPGWLASLLDCASEFPGFQQLRLPGAHPLVKMRALDVVALVAYAGMVLAALGVVLLLVALIVSPWGRFARRVRRNGQNLAERGLMIALTFGALALLIHGSQAVTVLALAAATTAVVLHVLPRLDRTQRMAVVVALLTSQGALWSLTTLRSYVGAITRAWADPLHRLLLWPREWLPGYADPLLMAELLLLLAFVFGFFFSRNDIGLHDFWTYRIRSAFLRTSRAEEQEAKPPDATPRPPQCGCETTRTAERGDTPRRSAEREDELQRAIVDGPLSCLRPDHGAKKPGISPEVPILIVNTAVNVPASCDPTLRNRRTARFELGPYFTGSSASGWTETAHYHGSVTLANSLAISAAAVSSQAGHHTSGPLRMLLALANISLGVWIRNPLLAPKNDVVDPRFRRWGHFWIAYQIYDLLGRNSETDPLLFISDGGHHDNLGLGALIERECDRIVCVDAGADPDYTCSSLSDVLRMLQIDQRWDFAFFIEGTACSFVDACAALAGGKGPLEIRARSRAGKELRIRYYKAARLTDVPIAVESYAAKHRDFPHEATSDQFFDEPQFEAYYQLGRRLGRAIVPFLAEDERRAD